jgi:hypothetical protein
VPEPLDELVLTLKDGDILLVRDADLMEKLQNLAWLSTQPAPRVQLIYIGSDDLLRVNEEHMNSAGWYRHG